ncbi:hypothetical protein ACHHYP_01702 [Achlya hypogyna]|uniref:Uncharacterized protein n=1 Tax=Achlya hypogyna TaxID=1202772 RepID=A0A1V9ZT87_ACHHY|nr:hypothetical protein ACHHYP_01702 [Achlya hypogyna]
MSSTTHDVVTVRVDVDVASSTTPVDDQDVIELERVPKDATGPITKNVLFPSPFHAPTSPHLSSLRDALVIVNMVLLRWPDEIFSEPMMALSLHRACYTNDGAVTLGAIATAVLNARSEHDTCRRAVHEWCSIAVSLLKGYMRLVQTQAAATEKAQRTILVKVATEAITKMANASRALGHVYNHLSLVVAHLGALMGQLRLVSVAATTHLNTNISAICDGYKTPQSSETGDISDGGTQPQRDFMGSVGSTVNAMITGVFHLSRRPRHEEHGETNQEKIVSPSPMPRTDYVQQDLLRIKDVIVAFATHFKNGQDALTGQIKTLEGLASIATNPTTSPLFDGSMSRELVHATDVLIHECSAYLQSHK